MASTPQVAPPLEVEVVLGASSVTTLKEQYLTGLVFTDADGVEYPDSWYVHKISTAIAEFERLTKIRVLRRTITDERHDYIVNDYQLFAFLSLFEYPVVSVQRVAAVYPTGQFIVEFPLEWVRLTAQQGQIQLVPTQGTLSQVILGRGGSYLPIIYQGMGYLPQLFSVDYTAGFADGQVPLDISDAVMKLAAIRALTVAGETIFPPGVSSISAGIDGVSQSLGLVNNGQAPPVFAGRIRQYRMELGLEPGSRGAIQDIKEHYRGVVMRVM